MTESDDYDVVAEVVRKILIKRLSSEDGKQFALECFRSLARDDRLLDVLLPSSK